MQEGTTRNLVLKKMACDSMFGEVFAKFVQGCGNNKTSSQSFFQSFSEKI